METISKQPISSGLFEKLMKLFDIYPIGKGNKKLITLIDIVENFDPLMVKGLISCPTQWNSLLDLLIDKDIYNNGWLPYLMRRARKTNAPMPARENDNYKHSVDLIKDALNKSNNMDELREAIAEILF